MRIFTVRYPRLAESCIVYREKYATGKLKEDEKRVKKL